MHQQRFWGIGKAFWPNVENRTYMLQSQYCSENSKLNEFWQRGIFIARPFLIKDREDISGPGPVIPIPIPSFCITLQHTHTHTHTQKKSKLVIHLPSYTLWKTSLLQMCAHSQCGFLPILFDDPLLLSLSWSWASSVFSLVSTTAWRALISTTPYS